MTRFALERTAYILRGGQVLSLLNQLIVLITLRENGLKVQVIRLRSLNVSETLVIFIDGRLASLKVILVTIFSGET